MSRKHFYPGADDRLRGGPAPIQSLPADAPLFAPPAPDPPAPMKKRKEKKPCPSPPMPPMKPAPSAK